LAPSDFFLFGFLKEKLPEYQILDRESLKWYNHADVRRDFGRDIDIRFCSMDRTAQMGRQKQWRILSKVNLE
jgi:hypothetical protein